MTDAARSAAVAAADTLALGVRDLAERVNRAVLPGIAVTKSLRTRILFEVWSRMVLWMRSVGRLNNTEDFQAILAGNRALFELLIDMVLLHREATEDAAMRYWQWANSERMRLYETVARYYEERALPVPAMYRSGEAEQGELRLLYARIRREPATDAAVAGRLGQARRDPERRQAAVRPGRISSIAGMGIGPRAPFMPVHAPLMRPYSGKPALCVTPSAIRLYSCETSDPPGAPRPPRPYAARSTPVSA